MSVASVSPIVVYTAITGGYDSLKRQPPESRQHTDFVAFLDVPRSSAMWRVQPVHSGFSERVRNAKIHKILAHRYFPHAAYSLWMDGSVTIRFAHSVQRLIDLYLADRDMAVFAHSSRTCLYQEADICLRRKLDDPAVIFRQICRYTHERYPPNAGLAECTVVLRRHTPAVEAFNELWWEEVAGNSRRDQLSFPYAAAKAGLSYATFPGTISDNPLFLRSRHTTPLVPRVSRRVGRLLARYTSGLSAIVRSSMISIAPPRRRPERIDGVTQEDAAAPTIQSTIAPVSPAPAVPRGPGVGGVRRRVIAIGPLRHFPSWSWVGFDTARELSKYYEVETYDAWIPPACDVLLVVKERPPAPFLDKARRRGSRIVYSPIDVYPTRPRLDADMEFLRACHMVLVHSERLLPLVRPHCANSHFVEHHVRFATPTMAAFRAAGHVLWVGGCQYVPHLLRWLDRHPIDNELRILTDIDNYRARHAARILAAEIGVTLVMPRHETKLSGYPVFLWSERRQAEMMHECKASMDVKSTDDFNQMHKPPVKAQQMIASGVPFAVNPESYSAEYFSRRGFPLPSPADPERWLSREYWEATRLRGEALRAELSLEAVGARYRTLIDTLLP